MPASAKCTPIDRLASQQAHNKRVRKGLRLTELSSSRILDTTRGYPPLSRLEPWGSDPEVNMRRYRWARIACGSRMGRVDRRSHGLLLQDSIIIIIMSSRPFRAYVCLIITFTAAVLALLFRLLARRLTKQRLWYDDYLAILAFVCIINFVHPNTILIHDIALGGIILRCGLMA
jgi:hypothetical protein